MKKYSVKREDFKKIRTQFDLLKTWDKSDSIEELRTMDRIGFNIVKLYTCGHGYYVFNRSISKDLNSDKYPYSFFSSQYAFLEEDCEHDEFMLTLNTLLLF